MHARNVLEGPLCRERHAEMARPDLVHLAFGGNGAREAQPSAKELGEPERQPFKTRLQQAFQADQAVAAQDNLPRHDDQRSRHVFETRAVKHVADFDERILLQMQTFGLAARGTNRSRHIRRPANANWE